MCFGKPKVDTSYQDFQMKEAKRARAEEEDRQRRVTDGLNMIRAVFEGGSYAPMRRLDAAAIEKAKEDNLRKYNEWQASQASAAPARIPRPAGMTAHQYQRAMEGEGRYADHPYIRQERGVSTAGARGDNDKDGNGGILGQILKVAAKDELGDRTNILVAPGIYDPSTYQPEIYARGKTRKYAGMNPLLDQRRAAMEGYYLPQLDEERERAAKELTFALTRAGLLQSTAAGEKQADLGRQYGLQKGKILADIDADIANTRTRMNQSRSSIEAGLRASGDASMAADQALASAVTFRQDQPELNPIGNIFYGLAEGVGAARQGAEVGRIKRLATPNPIGSGSGRNVA